MLLGGLTLVVLGTAGVALSSSLWLTFACAVITGLGFGTAVVTINLLVAQSFPGNNVALLNLVNFFFGLGAVLGPALASLTIRAVDSALPALWVGIVLVAIVLPFTGRLSSRAAKTGQLPRDTLVHLVRSPLLWIMGALLLFYVGAENGLGAWTTTYMERTTQASPATGALVTAGFWLALTAGRMCATLIGSRIAPGPLLLGALTGATAGGIIVAVGTGSAPLATLGILILGFCFGPIFPTALALVSATFPEGTGTATSVVVALGALGGMIFPALQGYVQETVGPAPGMLIITLGVMVMLALSGGFRWVAQRA